MSHANFASGSPIIRNEQVLDVVRDGSRLLFDPTEGLYCHLDAVGSEIWGLLAEPRSLPALISILTEQFAVDAKTCETDTLAFLEVLEGKRFVSV